VRLKAPARWPCIWKVENNGKEKSIAYKKASSARGGANHRGKFLKPILAGPHRKGEGVGNFGLAAVLARRLRSQNAVIIVRENLEMPPFLKDVGKKAAQGNVWFPPEIEKKVGTVQRMAFFWNRLKKKSEVRLGIHEGGRRPNCESKKKWNLPGGVEGTNGTYRGGRTVWGTEQDPGNLG